MPPPCSASGRAVSRGPLAPRAAWKMGCRVPAGPNDEAQRSSETSAAPFRGPIIRPPWIYWAARSRDQLGNPASPTASTASSSPTIRTPITAAWPRRLTSRQVEPRDSLHVAAPVGSQDAVRAAATAAARRRPRRPSSAALIAYEIYDDALAEVQSARQPRAIRRRQATLGLIYSHKGKLSERHQRGQARLPAVHRRGREKMPGDMLEVLFPVGYWGLIARYSKARGLHPYVIAALMAQESTFDAEIRSHANAIGLMQIVPATGRRYARELRIPRFNAAKLTDPEINVRIGTAYFADLVERFGGCTTHWPATTPARRCRGGSPRSRAWRATSSSTTSRIPRRRTT